MSYALTQLTIAFERCVQQNWLSLPERAALDAMHRAVATIDVCDVRAPKGITPASYDGARLLAAEALADGASARNLRALALAAREAIEAGLRAAGWCEDDIATVRRAPRQGAVT